jgi:hypothetical protein
MNYFKIFLKAIEQERERKALEPKCYQCKSKKNLNLVCAPGIYYICDKCNKNNHIVSLIREKLKK